MVAPLLILVAHGLDGLTFLLAVQRWGISGESNPVAHLVVGAAGVGGLLLLKAAGASVAAGIVARARRWRTVMLLVAVLAAIVGAVANLGAVAL